MFGREICGGTDRMAYKLTGNMSFWVWHGDCKIYGEDAMLSGACETC